MKGFGVKNKYNARVIVSLLILYVIWSTTYIAIKEAVRTIPPMLMTGSRYLTAGGVLFLMMTFMKRKLPTAREWAGAACAGAFLVAGGTYFLAAGEQWVGSGISSVALAAVSIWTSLISFMTGRKSNRFEVLGLIIGFLGIVLLNYEKSMMMNSKGAICLILSPLFWAIGSVLTKKMPQTPGLMGAAIQMLCGGGIALILGFAIGERITVLPSPLSILSWTYLMLLGSLLSYTAYLYLFTHTTPALATSYAYVNPALAMFIGVVIAGEKVTMAAWAAMVVVITGIVFVIKGYAINRENCETR